MNLLRFTLIVCISLLFADSYSQENTVYQKGLSAEQNLKAINDITPYTVGGMGFDTRYEGVKGSPRLYDTLCPSLIKISGQKFYINLLSDLDLFRGNLLFIHPRTGKLLSLGSDYVEEAIFTYQGRDYLYRTSRGLQFDKEVKETKFFQVINDTLPEFIKMPVKVLIEADYKALYSADRRFDEFDTKYRYYIMGEDNIFHQVQLNRKSLEKLFPDKKEIIRRVSESDKSDNSETMVLRILKEF